MQVDTETVDTLDIPEYRSAEDRTDPANAGGDTEEQARALGWKPQDEFEGNPEKWTDAESFLEVHSKNNGVLRKALASQAKQLEALQRQMQGMDAAHRKIFDMQIKKQKEEFDQQIAFLKAQKREALRSGEHEAAADIDEQIDSLREKGPDLPDAPKTQPQQQTQDWRKNPVMMDWASRNPWFEKDEDMSAYAGGIGQAIRSANPQMDFKDLLEEVSVRVRKAFPQKFTASRRTPVESATPGATSAASGSRSYASLPKDAKTACDEAVADGQLTQKEWVELYYGYDDRRKR